MLKTSLGYLAGVLTMAVVVYLTGAHFAAPMFFAGIAAVIVPGVALLSSVERIRSVARFLSAFADSFSSASSRSSSRPPVVAFDKERVSGYRKPSPKQRSQILDDTIEEYLDENTFTAPSSRRAS